MKIGLLFALLFVMLESPPDVAGKQQGSSVDAQAIVDQFDRLPPAYEINSGASGKEPLPRSSAFAVYDRFPDGMPRTIIAAYTNGAEGAIRVIRASDTRAYSVAYEPKNLLLDGGPGCRVELVDVELDGVREVLISFDLMEGPPQDWLFRWDGMRLNNLGPSTVDEHGSESSLLTLASLVDLDHKGPLVLTSLKEPVGPDPVVYRFSAGRFVLDKAFLFVGTFESREGGSDSWEESFSLPEGSMGPYVLRIINGARDGSGRVGVIRIVLNGAEILSPKSFSKQVEFLTIPVTLEDENRIQVTLAGVPQGRVLITIEGQAAVQSSHGGAVQP